jgi:hypothetical protein
MGTKSREEGYGGPVQPSPTIAPCLNGGLGWLEVECAPPVRMVKLTETPEITPYRWVHPDEDR